MNTLHHTGQHKWSELQRILVSKLQMYPLQLWSMKLALLLGLVIGLLDLSSAQIIAPEPDNLEVATQPPPLSSELALVQIILYENTVEPR